VQVESEGQLPACRHWKRWLKLLVSVQVLSALKRLSSFKEHFLVVSVINQNSQVYVTALVYDRVVERAVDANIEALVLKERPFGQVFLNPVSNRKHIVHYFLGWFMLVTNFLDSQLQT
jgi:hypothetical protein